MASDRPDPDALLRRVVEEERRERRGRLTLFFGAAPGVGKTYAMLQAAWAESADGRDVVVGIAETHGRLETAALLDGLELLPRLAVSHRGVAIDEFDLDAALRRRPSLILLDELAHTNAAGSRHPKRWQDVEELLEAGIDVYSTMNVQHVESLNDVIAQITGIIVRETVPDSVLEEAHEIKLVDLPPDDLLERLKDGKVYLPAQAQRAIENFFRKGNLIALRELALRQTAERVDAQMRAYRSAQGIEQTWAVAEQVLVAVSPSPYSARLVRAARRMAGALHANWFAVYVASHGMRRMTKADDARLAANLHLAEQLGAEVVTLSGEKAVDEILRFSKERNITKIIVGKPVVGRFWHRFRPSLVDELVRSGGDIDVYVTAGDSAPGEAAAEKVPRAQVPIPAYMVCSVVVLACTGIAYGLFGRVQLPDVVMTYLLGIILVASRFALGPSIFAALASVAAFDFFFIPPYLTFSVGDLSHVVTFFVMFLVAVVISSLTNRIKSQARAAQRRALETAALYHLSRELAGARGTQQVIQQSGLQLEKAFGVDVAVFSPAGNGSLERVYASPRFAKDAVRDASIAHWVWAHRQAAGLGTSTLPSSSTLFLPLTASEGVVGVLGLTPAQADRFDSIDERRQLEAFAAQMALAMERAMLAEETAKTILDEAERLERLIRNLLDMTRLESGAVTVRKEWTPLEEVVGSALTRLDTRLAERDVSVELPRDLQLVPFDSVLIEQVLVNLLENAAKYGSGAIEISARRRPEEVLVEVADRGPGIAPGEEACIFEKFHRGIKEGGAAGVGLGLTICRAVVTAHGGKIWASNREGGGAKFSFTLPIAGEPPRLPADEHGARHPHTPDESTTT